jgi:WD40 repeat protein
MVYVGSVVKVFDIDTLEFEQLTGHSQSVITVDFNYGFLITGSSDKTLRVWKLNPLHESSCFQEVHVLNGHSDSINCVKLYAVAKKDKIGNDIFAVSGSKDATIRVWDLQQGCCIRILTGHLNQVMQLGIYKANPTSDTIPSLVSCSEDKTILIWNDALIPVEVNFITFMKSIVFLIYICFLIVLKIAITNFI